MHFQEIKIREYSEKAIDKLGQKLYEFNNLCGIREPLEAHNAVFILRMLQEKFKDFSYQEINEAFFDYLSGNTEKIENYGSFTPVFVSSVLNAYKTKRNRELALYHREMAKIIETKEPTPEEKEAIEREFMEVVLFKPYENSIEKGAILNFDDIDASMLFKKFFRLKLISVDEDTARRYREKAIKQIKEPKHALLNKENYREINMLIDRLKLIQKNPEDDREMESIVKNKSCSLYFVDWINQQIDKKTDLKTIYYDAKAKS